MKCVGIKAQAGYWSPQARKARSVSCRPPSPLTIHPDAPDVLGNGHNLHNLHQDPRRLAVYLFCGCWSVLTQNYRQLNTIPDDKGHCHERIDDGAYGSVIPTNRCWFTLLRAVSIQAMSGSRFWIHTTRRAAWAVALTATIMRLQKAFFSYWSEHE